MRTKEIATEGWEERFWAKVDKRGPDECWNWIAATQGTGYGVFGVLSGSRLAHRISYCIKHGGIQPGLYVCHHCDNRACVNPAHLFLGTALENIQDAVAKGRHAKGIEYSNALFTNADILYLRNSDLPQQVLADKFKTSVQHISSVQLGKIWKHVGGYISKNKTRKLSDAEVILIKMDNNAITDIAYKYGVSKVCISQLQLGRKRSSLAPEYTRKPKKKHHAN